MSQIKPQLFSGTRAKMTINGLNGQQTLYFVTDISININNNVRAVHTFGAPNARSVEPLSISCSLSFSRVIPLNKADGTAVNTSLVTIGIEPLIANITSADDVSVILEDNVTGKVVASIKNCRFSGRTLSAGAGNIATERVNMVGIYDAANGNAPAGIGM